jgi:hypothetical protein
MAVTLVTNPVETVSGVVRDIFAGFEDVEFIFKREDMTNVGVASGIGTNVRISTTSDLTTKISVGDGVYLFAAGDSGNYTYNESGLITVVTAAYIEADIDFIENATATASTYINYFKNYRLEVEVVNPDNSNIKILPFLLTDDGDDAGNITINVGIVNDKNTIDFEYTTGQLDDSVIKFKIRYRQNYTLNDGDVTDSYTLIVDEIILVYATEQPDYETFINMFDTPFLYEGYKNGVILCHSDNNMDDTSLQILYDELDINQNDLVSNTLITTLSSEYGLIFINFSGLSINEKTEYIRFKGNFVSGGDWNASDWDNADWKTT